MFCIIKLLPMSPETRLRFFCFVLFFCAASPAVKAQRFLADYDSTLFMNDTLRPLVKRFQNLAISGYIQPQFQVAQKEGAATVEGGNFSPHAGNRFLLRRARIKIDYVLPAVTRYPKALFTFQVDATERGVIVRDMFLRLYEPKKQNVSLTMGLFARPFGYEVNLASSYRETPERGRASQTLLPGERDIGAMISYETHTGLHTKPLLKFDAGIFNGTGPMGATDFDSYKDIAARLTLKEWRMSKRFLLTGGLSFLTGGWRQDAKYKYEMSTVNGLKTFALDSAVSNVGAKALRQYFGADVQLVLARRRGKTEWRAEYWRGIQPGTSATTVSPAAQPTGPTYWRTFDGAFFYLLHSIDADWELMLKYDWYDPNKAVAGGDIGRPGTNLAAADIKYSTFGLGLTRYFSGNFKMLAYHDFVRNEKTGLPDVADDLPDNVFTLRMQLRF